MTTMTQPIYISSHRASRRGRLERLAVGIGVALVTWADRRSADALDHEQQSRRVTLAADIREREQGALRLGQLR